MWHDIMRGELGKFRIDDTQYRKWIKDMIEKRKFVGIVAADDEGKIVGSGGIWLRDVHPRPWSSKSAEPYLLSMYTEPRYRGKGVATRIVKEAMKWCKKKGYSSARLHASNLGRRVYSKLGWKRTWEMRVSL